LLLHAVVHPADIRDRDGGILVMATLFGMFLEAHAGQSPAVRRPTRNNRTPLTSAASTVRLVSFDMRRGSILDLLPDFNHGGLRKHGGSKRANTATRTFEKQSGAAVPQVN
jgi:hypothetical protein